jgi:hypothetical protein
MILGAALTAFTVVQERKGAEQFKWLEGVWIAHINGGSIVEEWKLTSDSSLQGQCKFVNTNKEENVYEKLNFLCSGGQFSYNITLLNRSDQKQVRFVVTSYTTKGFVAENHEHDFPKRITYRLVSKDSIHAFVDGGPAQPDKKFDFYYSRQKN